MKIKNILLMSVFALGLTGCTLTQKANPTTNTNNTTITNVDTTTNNPITTTGTNPISTNTVTTPTSSTNVIVPTSTNVEPTTITGVTPTSTSTQTTPTSTATPTQPTTTTGYTTPTNNTGSTPTSSESHEAFSKTYTGYYEKMNGHLSTISDFKATLNSIISANLISSSYSKAWDILAEADAADDKNIECLYTGKKIGKTNHGGNVGQWNREHVWAKSHGIGESGYAYYDCHHLHATEVSINSDRGNLPFDDITSSSYSSDSYGNKWDSTAFEPRDEVKGDVARSMFYMVVRYESTPDLELEDKRTSKDSSAATLGKLSTLIKWAYEDPVSEFEIRRNETVYSYQNNRNPFIDNPEYLYYLYPQESEAYGVNLYNLADYVNGSAVTPTPGPTPTTPVTTPTTPTTSTTNTNTTPVINPGETVTATATSPNTRAQMDGSNQASALGLPSVFSAVGYNNGNSNNVGLYDNIRIYAGNTLNISVDSKYIITSIKIVIDQGGTNLEVSNSSSVISLSNEVYTINDNTFTLKNSASSGQVRLASIEVTYGLK